MAEHKPAVEKLDPFDPVNLRAHPEDVPAQKVLMSVAVRRPKRPEFFRVHSNENYRVDMYTMTREQGLDRVTYLISPEMRASIYAVPELSSELRLTRLLTCVNKNNTVFLWPVPLPDQDAKGAGYAWHSSALAVAEKAMSQWVRLVGNRDAGFYEAHLAQGDLGEPVWPAKSLRDLLELGFKHHVIDDPNHEVVRELRGEI